MALGFKMGASGSSGAKVYVDDVKTNAKEVRISTIVSSYTNIAHNVSTTPISLSQGSAVMFNDELHVLSGTNHIKWNGSEWVQVSTIPITISNYASAVVFNDELHVLSGTHHYKWDGTSWTSVSTIPISIGQNVNAVVFNGYIYTFKGDTSSSVKVFYKYRNGSSWGSESINLFSSSYFNNGARLITNGDKLHLIITNAHVVLSASGTSLHDDNTYIGLTNGFTTNAAVSIFANYICIISGTTMYRFDGTSYSTGWVSPVSLYYYTPLTTDNSKMYAIVSSKYYIISRRNINKIVESIT